MSPLAIKDPKLNNVLDVLADCVKPVVEHVEKLPQTTQNHYGDYMSAILRTAEMTGIKGDDKSQAYLCIGIAFERAGGNKAGIRSALRLLGALPNV